MQKKTLALITGLVLVTVVLFIIALRSNNQQTNEQAPQPSQAAVEPTLATPAHSTLSIAPLTIRPGQRGTADVTIDTADNDVTAVQLEIAYDPNVISNIQIKPGSLFPNPVVLINKSSKPGQYTYAFGITPNSQTVKGTGVVATISFTATGPIGKQTQLTLLPTSLVTARGVRNSVLKSATGTTITIGSAASGASVNTTTNTTTGGNTAGPTASAPNPKY